MKKRLFLAVAAVFAVSLGIFWIITRSSPPPPAPQQTRQNEAPPDTESQPAFDKQKYSIDDPTSPWVIVNKKRPIDLNYEPADLVTPNVLRDSRDSVKEQQLRREAALAVEKMFADAEKAGIRLLFASGYRSSTLQATYYNNYVARDGKEAADRYSARPGTSEHQTGLAFDLARPDRKCYLETCFADTAEGKWLAAKAANYGFIMRYPEGKEAETGYQYEPWHFRYVGLELTKELAASGLTMETFFGL